MQISSQYWTIITVNAIKAPTANPIANAHPIIGIHEVDIAIDNVLTALVKALIAA